MVEIISLSPLSPRLLAAVEPHMEGVARAGRVRRAMADDATLLEYRDYLSRLHGFIRPRAGWFDQIDISLGDRQSLGSPGLNRIQSDLQHLGLPASWLDETSDAETIDPPPSERLLFAVALGLERLMRSHALIVRTMLARHGTGIGPALTFQSATLAINPTAWETACHTIDRAFAGADPALTDEAIAVTASEIGALGRWMQ